MRTTDQERANAALEALDTCMTAHLQGDLVSAEFAMHTVIGLVHIDGDYRARHRLAFLTFALAKIVGEEIAAKYGVPGSSWLIRRNAGGEAFDDLPDGAQIAVTCVVSCLNDDEEGAAEVLADVANRSGDGAKRLAEMLGALVALHTQTHRGPAPPWLGDN